MMNDIGRWVKLYESKGGIPWVISKLTAADGELYIAIESPDPGSKRVILREWAESNFENTVKILRSAIEPVDEQEWSVEDETGGGIKHSVEE